MNKDGSIDQMFVPRKIETLASDIGIEKLPLGSEITVQCLKLSVSKGSAWMTRDTLLGSPSCNSNAQMANKDRDRTIGMPVLGYHRLFRRDGPC
jgi:hypothetical protein